MCISLRLHCPCLLSAISLLCCLNLFFPSDLYAEPLPEQEISVTGDAAYVGIPDSANMHIFLEQTSGSVEEAITALNARQRAITEPLKNAGIPVAISAISDRPSTAQLKPGAALTVKRTLLAELQDLSFLGRLLDSLMRIPGSQFSQPEYAIRNNKAAIEAAIVTATQRAKDKAEKIATSTNVKLGRLLGVLVTEEPEADALQSKLLNGETNAPDKERRLRVFSTVRYGIDYSKP